jgi:hypothetical protein
MGIEITSYDDIFDAFRLAAATAATAATKLIGILVSHL